MIVDIGDFIGEVAWERYIADHGQPVAGSKIQVNDDVLSFDGYEWGLQTKQCRNCRWYDIESEQKVVCNGGNIKLGSECLCPLPNSAIILGKDLVPYDEGTDCQTYEERE